MAYVEDVEKIIDKIKNNRPHWKLSGRRKNHLTITQLGSDTEDIFDEVYQNISVANYSSGPLQDNHIPPVDGDIWIFGLRLYGENPEGLNCYLKFQDKPNGLILWISLHEQEYPLDFPYSS
ncbi:hypothetical protein [Companilactobacillus zhongbaensis]|uniref:hypothetical protein n=1 Tax=Companilactobacillus zhongbaensis TaxID=2486009 RepID=UPI000F7A246D|nr:hypothetical protein [Companilactobacillus zhongbaensis]